MVCVVGVAIEVGFDEVRGKIKERNGLETHLNRQRERERTGNVEDDLVRKVRHWFSLQQCETRVRFC